MYYCTRIRDLRLKNADPESSHSTASTNLPNSGQSLITITTSIYTHSMMVLVWLDGIVPTTINSTQYDQ